MSSEKTTKYVAKVPIGNDKYRYFYDKKEYEAYLNGKKNNSESVDKQEKGFSIKSLFGGLANKTLDSIGNAYKKGEEVVNNLIKSVGEAVDKTVDKVTKDAEVATKKAIDKAAEESIKLVENTNKKVNDYLVKANDKNIYDMDSSTRDEKIKQVEKTKEWQDIVKRKDPEYVKKNKETGEYEYLIDDYILKKKHPILDVMDDLAYGRKVDINEITKDSASAAVKDYTKAAVHSVQAFMAVAGGLLMTKFKFQQGGYDEEVEALEIMVENGKEELNKTMKRTQQMSESDVQDIVTDVLNSSGVTENYDTASVEAAVKKALEELEKQNR